MKIFCEHFLFFCYARHMNPKYIFLDIDGTLYSPALHDTPKSALLAIQKARENGHYVFLCTGRTKNEAIPYLDYPTDGYIFATGATIEINEEVIFDAPIPIKDVKQLQAYAKQCNLHYMLEGGKASYCNPSGYEWARKYFNAEEIPLPKQYALLEELHIHNAEEVPAEDSIYKIFFFDDTLKGIHQYETLIQPPYKVTITHTKEGIFCGAEVTNATYTKSFGIEQVLKAFHAKQEDTLCIGDSINDADMLQYCKIGIVMGNGLEEVKKIADYVTTDILEDGIYHAFEHFGLI